MARHFIKCDGNNDVLFRKIKADDCDYRTTIIVPETHNAIIIKDGIALETLPSGKHKIYDKNNVIDKTISEFKEQIEVIFVSKTAKLNILWGTDQKFDMRDPITGTSIKLGASGEIEVQISNPRKAYLELIGQKEEFNIKDLKKRLQGRLLAEVQFQIANVMQQKNLSYDRLGEVLLPVSEAVMPHIAEFFEKDYGLKVFSFTISRVVLDNSEIEKINKAKAAAIARKHAVEDEETKFSREMDLKRLEREDYAKYLEVCRIVGWPATKKEAKSGECPNCGVKVPQDAKFCPVCGEEIKISRVKCPNCGKMMSKNDLFCKHCGHPAKE